MKHPIFIIVFILVTALAIYVAVSGFIKNYSVDQDKFSKQYLPEEYYLQPVKFISVDEKTGALSKSSEVRLPLELIRGKYIGLFFKDKWNIERDETNNSINTIFASKRLTDKSLSGFIIITIIPDKNSNNTNSVVVTYWEN